MVCNSKRGWDCCRPKQAVLDCWEVVADVILQQGLSFGPGDPTHMFSSQARDGIGVEASQGECDCCGLARAKRDKLRCGG
jgi:hypothetical protein